MQAYPTNPGAPAGGQTVYVHQQAPAPALNHSATVQSSSSSGTFESYNGTAGRVTGIIQLLCGIASIVLGIAGAAMPTVIGYSGYGIWAGLLFYLTAGLLGIFSKQKNTCVVGGYMAMSILASIFAGSMMIAGIVGALTTYDLCYYSYAYGYTCGRGYLEGARAVDSMLAIVGLIELVTSIVASAYCCGGACCGSTTTSRLQHTTVVTTQAAPMVITSGQYAPQPMVVQGVQGGMIQQPPPYTQQHAYPPPMPTAAQVNMGYAT